MAKEVKVKKVQNGFYVEAFYEDVGRIAHSVEDALVYVRELLALPDGVRVKKDKA